MDLSRDEKRFLEPYLAMKPREGKGWLAGVAVGVIICAGGVVLRFTGALRAAEPYFLLILVAGLVIIEQAVDYRQKWRLARILQKYAAAVRHAEPGGEEDETA